MGKHFGNLQRLKGVTYYCLSPNELRTFAGIFTPGISNTIRRFSENILPIGIPVVSAFLFVKYIKEEYHRSQLKNPDDYKNDE